MYSGIRLALCWRPVGWGNPSGPAISSKSAFITRIWNRTYQHPMPWATESSMEIAPAWSQELATFDPQLTLARTTNNKFELETYGVVSSTKGHPAPKTTTMSLRRRRGNQLTISFTFEFTITNPIPSHPINSISNSISIITSTLTSFPFHSILFWQFNFQFEHYDVSIRHT